MGIMKHHIMLVVLTLGLMPAPTVAQNLSHTPTTQAASRTEAPRPAAFALVDAMADLADAKTKAMSIIEPLVQHFMASPDMRQAEKEAPGFADVFTSIMLSAAITEQARIAPLKRDDLAQLYSQNLKDSELETAHRFFVSPIGQKLVRVTNANLSYQSSITDMVGPPDALLDAESIAPATGKTMQDMKRQAWQRSLSAFSQAEHKEIIAFFSSPVGKKFTALQKQKLDIDLKWFNAEMPLEVAARLDDDLQNALKKHWEAAQGSKTPSQ